MIVDNKHVDPHDYGNFYPVLNSTVDVTGIDRDTCTNLMDWYVSKRKMGHDPFNATDVMRIMKLAKGYLDGEYTFSDNIVVVCHELDPYRL
jgi:hypothetical protein